jgi:hypothetical protein
VLTIAISVASGVDALFSLARLLWRGSSWAGARLVAVLLVLNLRAKSRSVSCCRSSWAFCHPLILIT